VLGMAILSVFLVGPEVYVNCLSLPELVSLVPHQRVSYFGLWEVKNLENNNNSVTVAKESK
jgi:hypothetical protein